MTIFIVSVSNLNELSLPYSKSCMDSHTARGRQIGGWKVHYSGPGPVLCLQRYYQQVSSLVIVVPSLDFNVEVQWSVRIYGQTRMIELMVRHEPDKWTDDIERDLFPTSAMDTIGKMLDTSAFKTFLKCKEFANLLFKKGFEI